MHETATLYPPLQPVPAAAATPHAVFTVVGASLVAWLRSHSNLVGAITLTMLLLATFLDYWLG
jgi:hypothetical protein